MEHEPKKKTLVSGPVNVLRLEGHVGDVKKVVYLFFDHHLNHGERSECVDRQAIDLKSYIIENLENRTKDMPIIDIFLEEDHSNTVLKTDRTLGQKRKYIWDFTTYFNVLFKNRNDSETINNLINRIRLHYVDVRDYIQILDDTNKLYPDHICKYDPTLIPYLANRCKIRREIIDLLEKTSYSYTKLSLPEGYAPYYDGFPANIDINQLKEVAVDRLKNYFDKIKYRYKHDEVRNKLWRRFQYVLYMQYDVIWKADKMISFILDSRAMPERELFDKASLNYYGTTHSEDDLILREKWINFKSSDGINGLGGAANVWLMDLYTMRRLLDKDEITNVMIYTGARHSINYVKMLVRDFDFRITHASYTKERDMDKLNHYIKTSPEHITEYLIYQSNYDTRQCSDLTDFPKHFQ